MTLKKRIPSTFQDQICTSSGLFQCGSMGFLLGVLITNTYTGAVLYFGFFVLLLSFWLIIFYRRITLLVIIGMCMLFLGAYHSHSIHVKVDRKVDTIKTLSAHGLTKTHMSGKVKNLYQITQYKKKYTVCLESVGKSHISGQNICVLVSIPLNLSMKIGAPVQMEAYMRIPERFGAFNYTKYLQQKHIFAEVSTNLLIQKETAGKDPFFENIRSWSSRIMQSIYPPDTAQFLAGILLGERREIPEEQKEAFVRSGLMHIIAVSGFNITILLVFFGWLFRPLPVKLKVLSTLLGIVFFVGLVGLQPPVVRAAIMGVVGYIFLLHGQKPHTFNILLGTLLIFVVLHPFSLNYDVSMQLSFAAVIGIMYFQRFFNRVFAYLPNLFAIREALVLTCCALILTMPISMVFFEQISLVAPLANVLVTIVIPIAMLFGFLSVIIFPILPLLGIGIGFLGWICLNYILKVAHWTGGFQHATLEIDLGIYRWHFLIGYYLLVAFIILYWSEEKKSN